MFYRCTNLKNKRFVCLRNKRLCFLGLGLHILSWIRMGILQNLKGFGDGSSKWIRPTIYLFSSYLRTATRTDSEVSDISDDERNLPVNICLPMFYLFQDEHTRTRTPFSTAATYPIYRGFSRQVGVNCCFACLPKQHIVGTKWFLHFIYYIYYTNAGLPNLYHLCPACIHFFTYKKPEEGRMRSVQLYMQPLILRARAAYRAAVTSRGLLWMRCYGERE